MEKKLAIDKFNFNDFINKKILGDSPHNAVIGNWIRWWINDSNYDKKELLAVMEPGLTTTIGIPDITFLIKDKNNDFIPIGVAEIQFPQFKTKPKKSKKNLYIKKIKNMCECKKRHPQLKFALLSIPTTVTNGRFRNDKKRTINELIEEMKKVSKDSDLYWVLHIMKRINLPSAIDMWHGEDFAHIHIPGFSPHYFIKWEGQPDYYIIKDGEVVKKEIDESLY